MKRIIIAMFLICTVVATTGSGCTPRERTIAGLGLGGAAIGGLVSGDIGGAAIGGALGTGAGLLFAR